ncbi:MAG: DUF4148 domain-containing protein [Paraburkholderia sp.]|jgi:hypothetical protein|nr:DUF4148 domain-containing protein [Paraburkholderia sp.]
MNFIKSLVVAAAVALPVLSFAQSTQPITRAQVRQELVALQQAGYNPSADETQYPRNIQQAEARLHAHDSVATTSYGSPAAGTSASGARTDRSDIPGLGPIFAHS